MFYSVLLLSLNITVSVFMVSKLIVKVSYSAFNHRSRELAFCPLNSYVKLSTNVMSDYMRHKLRVLEVIRLKVNVDGLQCCIPAHTGGGKLSAYDRRISARTALHCYCRKLVIQNFTQNS